MRGFLRDLTGQRFGRLRVESYVGFDRHQKALWLCECICGATKVIRCRNLLSGGTISCGCWNREVHMRRGKDAVSVQHGHASHTQRSPTYISWTTLLARWTDRKPATICRRWKASFEAFLEDMGEKPANARLKRLGPGMFCKKNCEWRPRPRREP
jgi:hypothetical protein